MSDEKVLFVDDEQAVLTMLERAFSREKYQVRTAQTADAALSILQEENIPVMFFDLNMPGTSGLELCRRVRRERPMAMIFALTGYASMFELSECREAGFDDYFKKPADLALIKETVRTAFEKRRRWKKG